VKEYMQNRIENSGHRYKRKVVRGEKWVEKMTHISVKGMDDDDTETKQVGLQATL
jgi:hypothetical protein